MTISGDPKQQSNKKGGHEQIDVTRQIQWQSNNATGNPKRIKANSHNTKWTGPTECKESERKESTWKKIDNIQDREKIRLSEA